MPSIRAPLRSPRRLAPRGGIAVVAPSGPYDEAALDAAVERLGARYEVLSVPRRGARTGYLAAPDTERLDALVAAIADPKVDAVVCARGGFGATRLLAKLDVMDVARGAKLLVGFSDATALHAVWARAGLRSLHAPMAAQLGRLDETRFDRWVARIEGAPLEVAGLETITPGLATGPLLGGNLAVLTALAGTPHAAELRGAILFLEDVGERPYRVDRMLTQLADAGALDGLAGVVLGAFTEATPGPDGVRVEDVLAERFGGLGVPVARGLGAGHVDDNLELPLGATAVLDAAAGTLAVGGLYR